MGALGGTPTSFWGPHRVLGTSLQWQMSVPVGRQPLCDRAHRGTQKVKPGGRGPSGNLLPTVPEFLPAIGRPQDSGVVQWLSLYCPPLPPPLLVSSSVLCVKDPCPSCTCLPLKTGAFILPCPWGLGWHGVSSAVGLLGATEVVQMVGGTTGSGTLEPASPMAPASLPGVFLISPGAALLNVQPSVLLSVLSDNRGATLQCIKLLTSTRLN